MDNLRAAKEGDPGSTLSVDQAHASSRTRFSRHQPDLASVAQLPDSSSLGELSEEIRERVVHRVKQLPVLGPYTSDETSSEEDEPAPINHRKPLRSGKLHTVDTQLIHCVTLPHKFVYSADGQPAVYEILPIPLCVSGYVKVMDAANKWPLRLSWLPS